MSRVPTQAGPTHLKMASTLEYTVGFLKNVDRGLIVCLKFCFVESPFQTGVSVNPYPRHSHSGLLLLRGLGQR